MIKGQAFIQDFFSGGGGGGGVFFLFFFLGGGGGGGAFLFLLRTASVERFFSYMMNLIKTHIRNSITDQKP